MRTGSQCSKHSACPTHYKLTVCPLPWSNKLPSKPLGPLSALLSAPLSTFQLAPAEWHRQPVLGSLSWSGTLPWFNTLRAQPLGSSGSKCTALSRLIQSKRNRSHVDAIFQMISCPPAYLHLYGRVYVKRVPEPSRDPSTHGAILRAVPLLTTFSARLKRVGTQFTSWPRLCFQWFRQPINCL